MSKIDPLEVKSSVETDSPLLNMPVSWKIWGLLLPFLFWLAIHGWGTLLPYSDNLFFYHWITYHFHYISQGIFPLWDPFRSWGWPDTTNPRFFGELNPIYLIIPLLKSVHVPQLLAFNAAIISYYWIGTIGFYLLVKRLCGGKDLPALFAYVILMFSMAGEILFFQLVVSLTLCPTAWFFYFLISFFQEGNIQNQKKFFLGLVFTLMILAVTYLPFFFIVVFGSVVVSALVLSPRVLVDSFRKILLFVRSCPVVFIVGIAAIVLACLPGANWYLSSQHGDIVMLTARNGFENSKGLANIPQAMINNSSISVRGTWSVLVSDLDMGMNVYVFVPFLLLIILALGALTRMDNLRRTIFLSTFLLFLISLANVTPVHPFLYQHVPFFRLFRNLYFLSPFLLAFMATLAALQLQDILGREFPRSQARRWNIIYVLVVHAILAAILLTQDAVVWTCYATLAGSTALFILHILGFFKTKRSWLIMGLLFLAILQPWQVLAHSNSGSWRDDRWKEEREEPFRYVRPLRGEDPASEEGFSLSPKRMRDVSGFLKEGYFGTNLSSKLYLNIPAKALEKYVSNKFIVYDSTAFMDGKDPDWRRIERTLESFVDQALVQDQDAVEGNWTNKNSPAQAIAGDTKQFSVISFGPNGIKFKTDFPSRKFLVFNDSYDPKWQVFLNGQKTKLFRANYAFKGVWVDKGPRVVEFRYGAFADYVLGWGSMILFLAWGAWVFRLFMPDLARYFIGQRKSS